MEGHSGIERERERARERERERDGEGAIGTDTDGEGEITIINICKGPDAHLRKPRSQWLPNRSAIVPFGVVLVPG